MVFFGLFNTASGLPITSAGLGIVAKKTLDAGVQSTCSGIISEPGGGQYRFQGWTSDFAGSVLGLMFTASGAAPVHYNITTTANVSGNLFTASGNRIVSGQVWLSSGQAVSLNSGQQVQVYSGQLSGQVLDLNSGQSFLASGLRVVAASVLDKSGYLLSASGLDAIQVEPGMNFRQSQSAIGAACAGRLSGAGTTSILMDGANASGTGRINAVVDASGNRVSVILQLPI